MAIFGIMGISTDDSNQSSTRSHQFLVEGDVTGRVIGAFFAVYNGLRHGYLESVYLNALEIEFKQRGISYSREFPISVYYGETCVGTYRVDFLVEGRVVVEVKASRAIGEPDRKQVVHYLRGTRMKVGLLLHFGPKAEFYRFAE